MIQLFKELQRKVLMMVASAVIEKINDDSGIQKNQVSVLQNEVHSDYDRVQEYGFSSVPLAGCQAIIVCVGGSRDHGAVIATEDTRYRPKNLNPGEVQVYNDKGDYVKFKDGRIMEVVAGTKIQINCPAIQITHTDGQGTDAHVQIDGNLVVNGNIDARGDVTDNDNTNNANMQDMRNTYNTHTHPGDSGGTTGAPNQSVS